MHSFNNSPLQKKHGAQAVDALSKDKTPPGMTPLEWCQAQSQDPIISQGLALVAQNVLSPYLILLQFMHCYFSNFN